MDIIFLLRIEYLDFLKVERMKCILSIGSFIRFLGVISRRGRWKFRGWVFKRRGECLWIVFSV